MRSKWIVLAFGLLAGTILFFDTVASHPDRAISVPMQNADGQHIGVIVLQPVTHGRTLITVNLNNLSEGFHGFHIHETGLCEVNSEGVFVSANGHFDLTSANHGEHSGDLPVLEADASGHAFLAVHTARFHFDDLADIDGSAFIVHSGHDNFANIPVRYGEADSITLSNGDAGSRIACGVISAPK
ncbi:MAG: hypothetical protein Phog2KO_09910 [Phototrophicaceae bacterium]